MLAYIISLKDPSDARNAALAALLARNGIATRFVAGIKGKGLPASSYFAAIHHYFSATLRTITPAELGCGLSHIKAFEAFLRTKAEFAIIFEDDVILDDAGCAKISRLVQARLYEHALLHLGGLDGLESLCEGLRGELVIDDPKTFRILPYDLSKLSRMVGYVISREIATKYVTAFQNHAFVVDDFVYAQKHVGIRSVFFSNIVSHPIDLSDSAIHPERTYIWLTPAYANNIWGIRAAVRRSLALRYNRLKCSWARLINARETVQVFHGGEIGGVTERGAPSDQATSSKEDAVDQRSTPKVETS